MSLTNPTATMQRQDNDMDQNLIELLRRLAAIEHPEYAGEIDGGLYCFFCGSWIECDPHEQDCLWIEAREAVRTMT